MDEKNQTEDLIINNDGSFNEESQGSPIQVIVKSVSSNDNAVGDLDQVAAELVNQPELNETAPPPNMEVTVDPDPQTDHENVEVVQDATFDSSSTREVRVAPENIEDTPASPPDSKRVSPFEDLTINTISTTKNELLIAPVKDKGDGHTKNPNETRNNRKLAALVTVFAALILSGAVLFVFLSAQNNAKEASDQVNESKSQETTVPAANTQNDSIGSLIDNSIKSADDSELGEDTLTDQALGLQ